MLNDLKRVVCKANKDLAQHGIVKFTWGNVSGFDISTGLFVIKPSGVPYGELQPELMVVMSLDGQKVEGRLNPSSDSETHRAMYMSWAMNVGGIVHTHSTFATSFAQAGLPIPALGTTHADTFFGDVPVTRHMTDEEISGAYELETGNLIVSSVPDPQGVHAILVREHGPFAWGCTPAEAVMNAVVLEETAKMAFLTQALNPEAAGMSRALMERHYLRKHGPGAYYGQK